MWDTLIEHCSEDRLDKYLGKVAKDTLVAEFMYVANQKISESLYPLISILEVSLRNRVHTKLHQRFGRTDWWTHNDLNVQSFQECKERIERAKSAIFHRSAAIRNKNQVKASQVVAEVSLNFWTSLFSEDLQRVLWKDLLTCFPNIPEDFRKRRAVAKPIQSVMALRNRVMHHEPILFDPSTSPDSVHKKGTDLVTWMSPEMATWLSKRDRFQEVWAEYEGVHTQMLTWLESRNRLNAARNEHQQLKPFYDIVRNEKDQLDQLAYRYLGRAKKA